MLTPARAEVLAAWLASDVGRPTFTAGARASKEVSGGFWFVLPRRGKRALWHTVTLNRGVPPRRELMGLAWGLVRQDRSEPLRWVGRTNRRGEFTVRGPSEGSYAVWYVAVAADETDRAILQRVAERRQERKLHNHLRDLLRNLRLEDVPAGQLASRPLIDRLKESLSPEEWPDPLAFYERAARAVDLLLRKSRQPDRSGTTLANSTQTRLDDELRPLSAPERELLDAGTNMARVYRLSRRAGLSEAEIARLLGRDEAEVARTLRFARAWAEQEQV
ncbi:MAG TPA: hypothetical protein VMG10_11610 [Gemmataceae bacterium]|nr:hypothetical protein [Gemmataceae bacterium]